MAAARVRQGAVIVAAAIATTALCLAPAARAATTGNISGTVTDGATKKPLAGVTVTANGPQGEQTEFTDSNGRYLITDLPPGEYVVRFYYSNVKIERPGVILQADKTLSVSVAIPTRTAREVKVVIKERAPTIDVATTQVQTQVTDELVKNAPVGRSYESVLSLTPGSTTDGAGLSFSGATGPENQFFIDGLNTTRPATGLIGTPLPIDFVKETEIITAGYNAEYGRATGGVVNVVTKSGTNEFHGGGWVFYAPLRLDPPRIARPGEAVARIARNVYNPGGANANDIDFGVDIGGPIIKNRLWFYGGFAPSFSTATLDRILRSRSSANFDPKMVTDTYLGDADTSITCPAYLRAQNPALCAPSSATAYRTDDLDQRFWRHYQSTTRNYTGIAKLSLRINDNHTLSATYMGSYSSVNGVAGSRFNGNPDTDLYFSSRPSQTHDVVATYFAKLLDHKLQVDISAGWHYEKSEVTPTALGAAAGINTDTRSLSLQAFEDTIEPCKSVKLARADGVSTATFNPCPVTNYLDGGLGGIDREVNQRAAFTAGATYFLKLAGTHAIKLGADFEYNWLQHFRANTGGANGGSFTTFGDASGNVTDVQRNQYGSVDPTDPTGQRILLFNGAGGNPLGFTATTSTLNQAIYLRDAWSIRYVPGLTVNAGVRWEGQQVRDVTGKTQIGIYDNWAPRLGAVWDFSRKGRSKVYASYGRYYESIPLDINDRQFSGEGILIQDLLPTLPDGSPNPNACKSDSSGRVDLTSCKYAAPTRADLNGGEYGKVSPKLQGQYSNEYVIGAQYDVGLDIVLGAAYVHRDLGRIIEDVSADGGRTYVIANPGVPADPGVVLDLQNKIAATSDMTEKNNLIKQLALYKAAAGFDPPKRDYNALVLTAGKRFTHNFIVTTSYTYSRTIGNYPGLFQANTGQLDPNISSQYDLPELLVNRNGPLPSDRPHNFKLTGAYFQPLGVVGGLTVGLNFFAISGTPIEVLGRHPTYGNNETFILPRGSGGRTPMVTQLDLHIAYAKQFGGRYRAEISLDIFNVVNQQQVTAVDQLYALDRVVPIADGTFDQLKDLKTTSGTSPRLNPNYGQPTGYQAPLSLRVGARFSF